MDSKPKSTVAQLLVLACALSLSLYLGRLIAPGWSGFDSPANRSIYCLAITSLIILSNSTMLVIKRGFVGDYTHSAALAALLFFITYFLFFPIYPVGFTYLPYSIFWCLATALYWESANRLLDLRIGIIIRAVVYALVLVLPMFLYRPTGLVKLPELWIICQLLLSVVSKKSLAGDRRKDQVQNRRKNTLFLTITTIGVGLGILLMLWLNNFSWTYDADGEFKSRQDQFLRSASGRHAKFETYLQAITNGKNNTVALSYIDSAQMVLRTREEQYELDIAKAKVLLALDKANSAVVILNKLVDHYPKDAKLYILRSKAHHRLSDKKSEISDLRKASNLGNSDASRMLDALAVQSPAK